MSIRTGICKHCGRKEEDHYGRYKRCAFKWDSEWYEDSGLFALDAHKEELYEAAKEFTESKVGVNMGSSFERLQFILNQIEKEK